MSPLALYFLFKLLAKDAETNPVGYTSNSMGFLAAFLEEKIKAEILQQKTNGLTNLPVNYTYLNELKKDKVKLEEKGISNWINKIEIKKKYKAFEEI